MSTFSLIKQIQDSQGYANLDLDGKMVVNQQLLDIAKTDDTYGVLPTESRKTVDKLILSNMPGYDPASIIGDDFESERYRDILVQAEAIKTGQADLNALDGIVEGGRGWLSGKLLSAITDVFIEGDLTKSIYGDKGQELERYRDYLMEVNNPEGVGDYKVGKVAGNLLGFGMDAAAMAATYGSVGAPGFLAKAAGQPVAKVFAASMARATAKGGLAKAMALVPVVGKQAVIEGVGYVGEELVADLVTGIINEDTTLDEYMKTVPSDLVRGLMYFGFGETAGVILSGAGKGIGKIFTGKGARTETIFQAKARSAEEASELFLFNLAHSGATDAEIKSLAGARYDPEALKLVRQRVVDAKLIEESLSGTVPINRVEEALFRSMHNMDTEIAGDVITVKSFGGETLKTPAVLKNNEELSKFFADNLSKMDNKKIIENRKFMMSERGKLDLSVRTTGLKPSTQDANKISELFGVNSGSRIQTKEPYENVVKELLGENSRVKVVELDTLPRTGVPLTKDTVYIPKNVKTTRHAQQFTKAFYGQISALSEGRVKVDTSQLEALVRSQSDVRYTPNFLRDSLAGGKGKYKTDEKTGNIVVSLADGSISEYPNIVRAGAGIHAKDYSPIELDRVLGRRNGIEVSLDVANGGLLVKRPGKALEHFDTMEDIFMNKSLRPGLPYEQRPPVLYLEDGILGEKRISQGTIPQLTEKAQMYEESSKFYKDIHKVDTKTLTGIPGLDSYKVSIGDTGLSKEFSTINEATEWMGKNFEKFDVMRDEAYSRGWRLEPTKSGGYKVLSPGKDAYEVSNLKDAQKVISNLDNVFNTPDFLDVAAISAFKQAVPIVQQADKILKKAYKGTIETKKKYSGKKAPRIVQALREWAMPIRDRLEASGEHVAVGLFDESATGYKVFHNQNTKSENFLEAVLHGKGRNLSNKQLRDMGSILSAETEKSEWFKVAKNLGIELDPKQVTAMNTLSDGMQILGKKFGIPYKDWVENYWTKLQGMTREKAERMIASGTAAEVSPYFKHLRIEDYLAANLETNAEHIFKSYMRMGNRELYLNPVISKIKETVSLAKKDKSLSTEAINLLEDTNIKLVGRTFSTDLARDASNRLATNSARAESILAGEGRFEGWSPEKRARKAEIELKKDYKQYANDLTTSALMAGKMKLPMRNMTQVITVLSPLAGGGNVKNAMKQMGDDAFLTATYKDGFNKGIIKPRTGYSYDHGAIMDRVKNWNQIGLNNFFNSDDYTRLVAMTSARDVFRNGQALLEEGGIDLEGFLKVCQIDYLGATDKINFVELIKQGKLETAETFLQRRWTEMTMFEYEQISRPEKLNSGLGKLLGQFSTYPLSLTQFMKRGWKAEGSWFATKLLMGTTSTALFFSEILGIEGTINANPMENIMFLGGPSIGLGAQTMVNLKQFSFNPTVAGAQNIGREVQKTFTPFYGIGSKLMDGVNAINEGDYHRALINSLGGKANEEALIRTGF